MSLILKAWICFPREARGMILVLIQIHEPFQSKGKKDKKNH